MNKSIRVCKYQSINTNSLSNLSKGVLWGSFKSAFNDPFEFLYSEIGLNSKDDEMHKFINEWISKLNQIKIICLSEDSKSILMWSHYAEMHYGMCLEFEIEESEMIQVTYTNTIPTFNYDERKEFYLSGNLLVGPYQINLAKQLLKLFGHKEINWAYEKEWRIILTPEESNLFEYGQRLKRIIFGLRTPIDQINLIRSLLKHQEIEFAMCERVPGKFELRHIYF